MFKTLKDKEHLFLLFLTAPHYGEPVLHDNIKHMSAMLPVIGYEMQMPSGRVYAVHIIREIYAHKCSMVEWQTGNEAQETVSF